MLQPDALAKLGDTVEMSFEDQFPWPEPSGDESTFEG